MKSCNKGFETCIFDLYGTLVDIHTSEDNKEVWEKLALFYGYYGADYSAEELENSYLRIVGNMETGKVQKRSDSHEAFPEIQIEQVFLQLFTEKRVNAELSLAVHAGQFFRVMSTEYLKLYEGTTEMLQALQNHHKKIYLLSNAQRIFTEYEMKALKIEQFFDGIFISSDYEYKKPDIRFFEKLINTYQISVPNAIMIGNDGVCDIEGAKRAGLATLYVHSNISPKEKMPDADYVLEHMDMEQIKSILLN